MPIMLTMSIQEPPILMGNNRIKMKKLRILLSQSLPIHQRRLEVDLESMIKRRRTLMSLRGLQEDLRKSEVSFKIMLNNQRNCQDHQVSKNPPNRIKKNSKERQRRRKDSRKSVKMSKSV